MEKLAICEAPVLTLFPPSLYFHRFLGKNKPRKWRGWRPCVLTRWSLVRTPHLSGGGVSLPTWGGSSSLGNGGRRKVKSSSTHQQVRWLLAFFLIGCSLSQTLHLNLEDLLSISCLTQSRDSSLGIALAFNNCWYGKNWILNLSCCPFSHGGFSFLLLAIFLI